MKLWIERIVILAVLLSTLLITAFMNDARVLYAEERDVLKLRNMDAGDKISFAGRMWIVLNPEEGYIFSDSSFGNRAFDTDNKNKFDPDSPTNIGYYLKVTFYEELTVQEQEAIQETTWDIGRYGDVEANIGLLSVDEWNEYKHLIGNRGERVWLRTPNLEGPFLRAVSLDGNTIYSLEPNNSSIVAVYPALTLDPNSIISALHEVIFTEVIFSSNGDDNWAQSHSTTVYVTNYDSTKPLQYAWSTDTDLPTNENDWSDFSNETELTTPESATGDYYLHVRGTDAGEVFNDISNVFKIDNTPPDTPTIYASTEWTNEDQVINIIHGDDAHSGVAKTIFRLGDGEWETYEEEITIDTEGEITIQAKTIDLVGNESEIAENTVKIDRTAPKLTLLGENPLSFEIGIKYVDPGATAVDNVDGDISNQIVITGEVDSSNLGEYEVRYNVSDRSGNKAMEAVRTVHVIDRTPPEIEVTMTYGADEEEYTDDTWTNQPVTFFIEAKDDNDMKSLEIWIDGNEVTDIKDFTHKLTFDEPSLYELFFKATDQSENETAGEHTIKIDKRKPNVEFAMNGNDTPARSVSTTVTVIDLDSSVNHDSLRYIWTENEQAPLLEDDNWKPFENNTEELTKERAKGIWYLHIYSEDNAGNSQTTSSSPFQLHLPASEGGSGGSPSFSSDTTFNRFELEMGEDELLDFNPEVFAYTLETEAEEFELFLEPSHPNASIKINDEEVKGKVNRKLNEGENVFQIVITAENGNENEYTLTIYRLKRFPFPDIEDYWAQEYIIDAHDNGWFNGYPNGKFGPENNLTRMQSASLFVRILGLDRGESVPFTDIQNIESETIKELEKAYANDIINGYSDQTFKPYAYVTRAQLALMIARSYEKVNGAPYNPNQSANFPDIAGYDKETQDAITMLVELGIAEGSQGKFMPNNLATRAHAAKMLVNFKKVLDE